MPFPNSTFLKGRIPVGGPFLPDGGAILYSLFRSTKERKEEPALEGDAKTTTKMIVSENLRTASLYINNQLLSRGLLRDGQNIDFTNPGESEEEMGETMSRIMSVVNDLILRRDVSFYTQFPPLLQDIGVLTETNTARCRAP